jgi:KTSC domain
VRAVGYDPETSTLEIEFRNSSVCHYAQVSEEVYNGLNSLGFDLEKTDLKYFNEHIKGKYKQKTIRRPRLNLFKGILES